MSPAGGAELTQALRDIPDAGRPDGAGTVDDPIAVGDDVERARELLAEGKHVRLSQPDQIATLLDRIVETVQDAENKGVKAPNYDLCKVSVPGTNLFCKDNRGIPRIQMPQLKAKPVPGSIAAEKGGGAKVDMAPEFIAEMQAAGIKTTEKTLPASHMRASQMELSGAAVAAFVVDARNKNPKALAALSAPLFVTRDGYVVDGHHRWAALVALDAADGKIDGDVPMNVRELDTDIGRALDMANEFTARVGLRHQAHGEGSVDVTPDTRR